MLSLLNAAQLVLYIALLVLLGQGVLWLLIGSARHQNVFYGLLTILAKPAIWPVHWLLCSVLPRLFSPRWRTSAQTAQRLVPVLSFALLLLAYAVVTFARIDHCVTAQQLGQPGCR